MALDKDAVSELLDAPRAGGDLDLVRSGLQLVLQALFEPEAAQAIGAAPYQRSPERTSHRNGHRERVLRPRPATSRCGSPEFRSGSLDLRCWSLPSLLEPRRPIDRALWAVIMEAYVHGVSTRKVDDLVRALGIDAGVSQVRGQPHLRQARGAVGAFRDRSLSHASFPFLSLDATYLKAHEGPQVVSKAVVIATACAPTAGARCSGWRSGFRRRGVWAAFLRSLRARGPLGGSAGDLGRLRGPQGCQGGDDRRGMRAALLAS